MTPHCFVIFRDGRRACAGRPPLEHSGDDVWLGTRRFQRWHSFCHFHHIVGKERQLLGFQLVFLDFPPEAASWWRWVECCENCSYTDKEFTVLLAEALPEEYYPDSASIIGGDVYHDGCGEFIVVIPDMNEWRAPERNWGRMWNSIGFDLAEVEVRRESRQLTPNKCAGANGSPARPFQRLRQFVTLICVQPLFPAAVAQLGR